MQKKCRIKTAAVPGGETEREGKSHKMKTLREKSDAISVKGTLCSPETVFSKDLVHAGKGILSVLFYRNIGKTTGS